MRKDLVAASSEPIILALLSRGENYGYAIIQEIRKRSREKIKWTDGMLYPVLHRLERNRCIKARWVEADNGRKRKYYAITKEGRGILASHRKEWTAVHSLLDTLGPSGAPQRIG